jgi:hypothetical protein
MHTKPIWDGELLDFYMIQSSHGGGDTGNFF